MTARAAYRQDLAQAHVRDNLPFAAQTGAGHYDPCGADMIGAADLFCLPFPYNWPGHDVVGPFFCSALRKAAKASAQKKSSQARAIVIELATIITNFRGTSCGNLWQSPFWSCHLQAVWTTIFSAVCWARGLARRWFRSQAAMQLLARFWAACSALSATMSTSAAAANTAQTREILMKRPNGHSARLAFLHAHDGQWPACYVG